MECSICEELFEPVQRRPRILPCGHTFCSVCVRSRKFGKKCPIDNKVVTVPISKLPENLILLDNQPASLRLAYHCRDCDAPSKDTCVEGGHRLTTLRQLRAERAGPPLRQLQQGSAVARGVLRLLEQEDEALHQRIQLWRGRLEAFQAAERKLSAASEAASADPDDLAQALADTAHQAEEGSALERSGLLLLAAGVGSVTLRVKMGDTGWDWDATVELPAVTEEEEQLLEADGQPEAKRARHDEDDEDEDSGVVRLMRLTLLQLQLEKMLEKLPDPALDLDDVAVTKEYTDEMKTALTKEPTIISPNETYPEIQVNKMAWDKIKPALQSTIPAAAGMDGDKEYVGALCLAMWGHAGLVTHSLTGKACNTNLNKQVKPVFPALPAAEVAAVTAALDIRIRQEQDAAKIQDKAWHKARLKKCNSYITAKINSAQKSKSGKELMLKTCANLMNQ